MKNKKNSNMSEKEIIEIKTDKKIVCFENQSFSSLLEKYNIDEILAAINNFLKEYPDHALVYLTGNFILWIYTYEIDVYIENIPMDAVEKILLETNTKMACDFLKETKRAFNIINIYNQFSDELKLKWQLEN